MKVVIAAALFLVTSAAIVKEPADFISPQDVTCSPPPEGDCFIEEVNPDKEVYNVNENANYQCTLPGYHIKGKGNRVTVGNAKCTRRGRFRARPDCERVLCGLPPAGGAGTNPVPSQVSLSYEEEYVYSCMTGYSLVAGMDTVTQCLEDGSFSLTTVPICERTSCGTPAPGVNTVPVPGSVQLGYGDTYTYECLDGYSSSDDMCTVCQSDGTFSLAGKEPNCTKIECPQPSPGSNTKDVPAGTLDYGDVYTYQCMEGYSTDEETCTVCQFDGTLSLAGNEPTCNVINCGTPKPGVNTEAQLMMDLTYGESFRYECMYGFSTENETCTTCLYEGVLSLEGKEPICTEIICGTPQDGVDTVPYIGSDLKYLETYTYQCRYGYYTSSETCTVCMPDGSLSLEGDEPVCMLITCGRPADGMNTVTVPPIDLSYQESYTYSCKEGYASDDEMCTVCREDGSLSLMGNEPVCEEIVCGVPPNGINTVNPTETQKYLDIYIYTCADGFSTTDDVISLCQPDGTFSISPPICTEVRGGCGIPEEGNNTYPVPQIELSSLEIYMYKCLDGFYSDDELCIVCYPDGTFSAEPPVCQPITCPPPSEGTNTKPVPGEFMGGMGYLDIYQYECLDGYQTNDELCQVCLPDGTLSLEFSPECTLSGCEAPPEGINTEPVPEGPFAIGATYQYSCVEGFVPYFPFLNMMETQCLEGDQWSLEPPPTCTKECDLFGGVVRAGIVPDTDCTKAYAYVVGGEDAPIESTCESGSIFDTDACVCVPTPVSFECPV